jgi:Uma2 family endonuclease
MGLPAIIEAEKTEWTEEEYLEGTGLDPEIRYEYVRGRVYAMATPSAAHAEISSNFFVPLHTLLKGKPCRAFIGNMALRINFLGKRAFYIPDVMVACDPNPKSNNFREEPLVLAEVMSPATAGNDLREKLLAYTAIPSLRHYLIINQSKAEVFHYQRSGTDWTDVTLTEADDRIVLPEPGFSLTVAELYAESGIPLKPNL